MDSDFGAVNDNGTDAPHPDGQQTTSRPGRRRGPERRKTEPREEEPKRPWHGRARQGTANNPGGGGVRPQILRPCAGRTLNEFAVELGKTIGQKSEDFVQAPDGQFARIEFENVTGEFDRFKLAKGGLKFVPVTAAGFRSDAEEYAEIGTNEKGFSLKTMLESESRGVLANRNFRKQIPRVSRILTIPIPILTAKGDVAYPREGLNRELEVYCNPRVPALPRYSVEAAKEIVEKAMSGFCWKDAQSKTHAWARLLTPYARGLMGFGERWPVWFFEGNRPRCGKDYLNGVTQIVYLGYVFEDFALGESNDETKKRITSALSSGRQMMHFANCEVFLSSTGFIQVATASMIGDRRLGGNTGRHDLQLPNEIDYSLSANVGLGYDAQVELRMRKIGLAFFEEDANKRTFMNPRLHAWVKEHRLEILGAIASLFDAWIKAGMPLGKTLFTSFPRWAEVIGGLMEHLGVGDPCQSHAEEELYGGNTKENAMRALFNHCKEAFGLGVRVRKTEIYDVIQRNRDDDPRLEWFGDFCGDAKERRSAETRTGSALAKFRNRVLGGVKLVIDPSDTNSNRWEYSFVLE